ncbi:MAG: type II toxin-antitoxin system Phd/YefM family antitoxin [Magnetococcales bacterium]|nr:type II toxin-antitoxin system Phd/YefM family antitoxin [Magnetococcales bacterium]
MKLSEQVKPISYLKAHAPEIIRGLAEGNDPMIITLHGEANAVLQGIDTYEETQETLAFLKLLAMGNWEIKQGEVMPAMEIVNQLRKA